MRMGFESTCARTIITSTILNTMSKTFITAHALQEAPRYSASEAAHYLRVPVSTVRAWAFGQTYESRDGTKHFRSVIELADRPGKKLSFVNLVELFVLAAIRRKHGVALREVRKALDYLKKKFPSKHPLADNQFESDDIDLFVENFGAYLASQFPASLFSSTTVCVANALHGMVNRAHSQTAPFISRCHDPANSRS
ncbi:MAG: hypothetical protein LH481_16465 [Burkholderiales bacterium]|nr:hypothetical protein [Burkholderiales bacterium]